MSEDLPQNEKLNRKKREQQKRDAITERLIIQSLMAHRDGRRWVWLRLEEAKVFSQTLVLGQADATAFQEGKRSWGLQLIANVTRYAPEAYIQMTRENAAVELAEEPTDVVSDTDS
jgi:hypothetical protein